MVVETALTAVLRTYRRSNRPPGTGYRPDGSIRTFSASTLRERRAVPISYRIDQERRLVLTRAWGVLTDDDIINHKERLARDPEFDPVIPQLTDARDIEQFAVTIAGVHAMIAHDAAHASRRAGHRLALVVGTDEVFGMARMYELMGERSDNSVAVFRTIADAETWLATGWVPPEPPSRTE